MTDLKVQLRRLDESLSLPAYETEQAAGMDLRASEGLTIEPGEIRAVGTGLQIQLPQGYEAQIRPRSGLALKRGISIPNAPGTIDADYRGEIKVILINLGKEAFVIERGDRIAQMVVAPVCRVVWQETEQLDETKRGEGGFSSTGLR